MTVAFTDLVKTYTVAQLEQTAHTALSLLGFPVASWQKGSVIRTLVRLFAELLKPVVDTMALIARSGFLDWAEGIWLDLVAEQVYLVTRIPATFASGEIKLDNSAGGLYTYAAGQFRVYNPATKKTYKNVANFTLNPLEVDKYVAVTAEFAGSGGSSAAGTITAFETPLVGVTVTNPVAFIGVDAELDPSLRLRCRLKLSSLSPNGAKGAYEYIARTPELNGGVIVTRAREVAESSLGQSTLYVAGPNGALTGPEVALIQDAINRLAVPTGYDCIVTNTTNKPMGVTSTVYVYGTLGLEDAAIQAAVLETLTAWVPTIPIGGDYTTPGAGRVFVNTIEAQIQSSKTDAAAGLQIHRVVLTLPASDFVVAANEVVTLLSVATTVTQVTT
jgi:hypothetical protein